MADSKLQPLLDAAAKANNLPWRIYRRETPHYLGHSHVENCIGTVRDDPQLHGPFPVITLGFGLGATKGDPAVPLLSIYERDANFITAASEAIPEIQRLVSLELRLREYVGSLKKYGSNFTPMELSSPGVEARMSFAAAQVKQLEEILENKP